VKSEKPSRKKGKGGNMKLFARILSPIIVAALLSLSPSALAESGGSDSWLPTLQTDTPQEGYELAVKLARMGVKTTQPDMEVLKKGRQEYAKDPDALMKASEVIAVHFKTIAAANGYWRDQ
jgi:hypothetical protein